jgi:5-methylcytosine-specific restriction endonuclease McrA
MKVSDKEIINAATSSRTMYEAARKVELHPTSFIFRARKLGVYCPNPQRLGVERHADERKRARIPLKEILAGKHPQYNTNLLRTRLLNEGYKQRRCEQCGNDDESISFELDHIDGDHSNHKLKNLQIICPNCHSKTPTFAGRNKRVKKKIQNFDLKIVDMIRAGETTRTILLKLGMVTNGVNYRRVDKIRQIVEYILT